MPFKWMSGRPFFFLSKHSSLMSCPKSKLLMSYRDYIKSHWCFLNFLKWFEQFTKIHTFFRKFKVGKKYCTIIAFKITSRQILWISIKYLDNIVMLDKKLVRDVELVWTLTLQRCLFVQKGQRLPIFTNSRIPSDFKPPLKYRVSHRYVDLDLTPF